MARRELVLTRFRPSVGQPNGLGGAGWIQSPTGPTPERGWNQIRSGLQVSNSALWRIVEIVIVMESGQKRFLKLILTM